MQADLKPASGVRLFVLEGESVLFAAATQNLHSLNPAATLIWCLIEEGQSFAQIAISLSQALQCRLREAELMLAELLQQWNDQGLLAGSAADAAPMPAAKVVTPGRSTAELPPSPSPAAMIEHRYRLLDREFCVRFETREQEDWVHSVLRHIEVRSSAIPPDQTIEMILQDAATLVIRNRRPLQVLSAPNRLAPFVKALLWRDVMEHQRLSLIFHAGVIGARGRCVLLPAAAGSGKSSLTAALAYFGFSFFSDEMAIIARDRFAVRPVPLGICVKSTGWQTLMPLYPELAEMRTHYRGDGKYVRYLPPPIGPGEDTFYPVGAIVFPQYAPDAETALRPLGKAEALRRLLKECLVVQEPLDERNVALLVDWVKSVPCYELTNSSLTRACHLLNGLTVSW